MELIQIQNKNIIQRWEVIAGQETADLLDNLKNIDSEAKIKLLAETTQILEQCGNPQTETNDETGLVFGYVQSGKTMSFTTLTALAKDNGFQIIIIIAGIATNLIDQSTTRLEKDLRINERNDRQWLSIKNPNLQSHYNTLKDKLEECKDPNFPIEEKRTILITVLKNTAHLRNLIELFVRLDKHLNAIPILIIDDESDQASLNTFEQKNAKSKKQNPVAEDKLSTIYKRILDLKKALPHHTFVQYTATPQANLFFNIYRNLSPNFIQLLSAGEAYTGGKVFFQERASELTQVIPDHDPTSQAPPTALLEALRWFFLGVAEGKKKKAQKNRCMMIHPSEKTNEHRLYTDWVKHTKSEWIEILQKEDTDTSKQELISEFNGTYNKLAKIATDVPLFAELSNQLLYAIRGTQIQEINAKGGKTPNINWQQEYAFILVGGNAMNRGYTVEGLTVTYMPRSIGGGMVDTIQQRARFFGYKRDYLNYCKIYLTQEAKDAYDDYVTHEEDMRMRLEEHKKSGKTLNEWFREVFLDTSYKLTRSNVIHDELSRTNFNDDWFFIKSPSQADIPHNQQIVEDLIEECGLMPYDTTTKDYETVRLKYIIDKLLNNLTYRASSDLHDFITLRTALHRFANDNPNELCRIYLLGSFDKPRERKKLKNGTFTSSGQFFQGRNARYEGDKALKQQKGAAFHIHILNIFDEENNLIAETVPAIAIYIPEDISPDTIRQTYQNLAE